MEHLTTVSSEEEDLRVRSTKKVKMDGQTEETMEDSTPVQINPASSSAPKPSYKDMVSSSEFMIQNPEDMVKAVLEELFPDFEDSDDDCPVAPSPVLASPPQQGQTPVIVNSEIDHATEINAPNADSAKDPLDYSKYFGPWMLAKKPQRRNFGVNRPGSHLEAIPLKPPQGPKQKPVRKEHHKIAGVNSQKPPPSKHTPAAPSKARGKKETQPEVPGIQKEVPTEEEISRRRKKQEILELMRRHQRRLHDQYLNGGIIVDVLGGTSFWGPSSDISNVPPHPFAPDKPDQGGDTQMDDLSSLLWKNIAKCWSHLSNCVCWILGDGSSVKFWRDPFIPSLGPLLNHSLRPIPFGLINLSASSYAENGAWTWNLIVDFLPQDIMLAIAGIKPPGDVEGPDHPTWLFSANGELSLKSAYQCLGNFGSSPHPPDAFFKQIWAWQGPPRISSFIWKLYHNRLLTNSERVRRGMTSDDSCPRCGQAPETIMHTLRDCEVVSELWESLIDREWWARFFSLGLDNWLKMNMAKSPFSVDGTPWNFIFPVSIWRLWKDRNDLVFNKRSDLPGNLYFQIVSYARQIINSIVSPCPISQRLYKNEELIGWSRPPPGFLSLILMAQLIALTILPAVSKLSCGGYGMVLNWPREIIFRTLSSTLTLRLRSTLSRVTLGGIIIVRILFKSIKRLLHENPSFFLSHAYGESNRAADHLAVLGYDLNLGIVFFESPLSSVIPFLAEDVRGVSFPRFVVAS
ncbi:Reverse transcriptase zinc-binding domain [Sesbania bispinosa]|nr:Reverse transcriptase zinc-binding domain [Sesbania bispinosa]